MLMGYGSYSWCWVMTPIHVAGLWQLSLLLGYDTHPCCWVTAAILVAGLSHPSMLLGYGSYPCSWVMTPIYVVGLRQLSLLLGYVSYPCSWVLAAAFNLKNCSGSYLFYLSYGSRLCSRAMAALLLPQIRHHPCSEAMAVILVAGFWQPCLYLGYVLHN